jgi:AAA domain (dynein-related subfamily)
MNVAYTLRTLMGLPPRKSILLESDHGVGKSTVVRKAAALLSQKHNKPFFLIDFRLAQCEVGDLIGMPKSMASTQVQRMVYVNGVLQVQSVLAENVTVHDLAEWFPTDPDSCGFLFLDELFRASKDLQNAVLELALDYRYHFRELPMGWRVVSASNDNLDVYAGTAPDPALYDRFLKIKFKPTHPEWMEYAREFGVHPSVLKYIEKFPRNLGLDRTGKIEPGKIIESPRSWISLSDCIIHMTNNGDEVLKDPNYLTYLAKGYLGDTTGLDFVEYVKKDYKVYSATDILDKWNAEMAEDFKAMLVTDIAFYETELWTHIKKANKPLSRKQSKNLLDWVRLIPKESAAGFWSKFSLECQGIASKWYKETPGATDYIYGFLAKKMALKDSK